MFRYKFINNYQKIAVLTVFIINIELTNVNVGYKFIYSYQKTAVVMVLINLLVSSFQKFR